MGNHAFRFLSQSELLFYLKNQSANKDRFCPNCLGSCDQRLVSLFQGQFISIKGPLEPGYTSRGSTIFHFWTRRRKFPYNLLNFAVSSLSSADNSGNRSANKPNSKSHLIRWGLLILGKPLPLLIGRPNRFILTNDKHPLLFHLTFTRNFRFFCLNGRTGNCI